MTPDRWRQIEALLHSALERKPGQRSAFLAGAFWSGGFQAMRAAGRTYALPIRTRTLLPDLPPEGFRSEAEVAAVPGVRLIDTADVGAGPTPDVYVYSRENVQRNLYRIPLP